MSESQFAYSHLTLDELRSMAASPQVGTMQAMPQSFRALADRVGEVADLLTRAQADLPNWWKGPAAEQAAATLGRAAAEAREFHSSALAAASAVGRCAQVVAAQQSQMMDVPEVAEPGATDVVPRPTTPFEALEAARQDATYQAAHGQAVQVVNGIAAQYLETHDELGMITTTRGEGFTNFTVVPNFPTDSARAQSDSDTRLRGTENNPQLRRFENDLTERHSAAGGVNPSNVHSPRPTMMDLSYPALVGSEPQAIALAPSSETLGHITSGPAPINSEQSAPGPISYTPAIGDEPSVSIRIPDAYEYARRPVRKSPSGQDSTTTKNELKSRGLSHETFDGYHHASTIGIDHGSYADNIHPVDLPKSAYNTNSDGNSSDNTALIPPYTGVGHAPRVHEERNPRPAYLKERKSTWLPDTVAAPADGVITPDWFHHV